MQKDLILDMPWCIQFNNWLLTWYQTFDFVTTTEQQNFNFEKFDKAVDFS